MSDLRLSYQTVEFGKTDIHLCTLRNKQEFHDPEGKAAKLGICSASWSLFGVVWPSSMVLAHFINGYDTKSKRVLEVGCGIGLSSLLLNKQNVNITATDHHPEVHKFLNRNTLLNGDENIEFVRTGWADEAKPLGVFDLIIGSDLLYEDAHIEQLSGFIQAHSQPTCEVIIVDPGRGRKNKLIKQMVALGFSCQSFKPEHTEFLTGEFKGQILEFKR